MHTTTGGHGSILHGTRYCNEHVSLSAHPPLSISHDGSQYGRPVGSCTLHWCPFGHLWSAQAVELKYVAHA